MMNILKYLMSSTLCIVLLASPALAENSPPINVGSKLPPKVRGLLIQEMHAILRATNKIVDALVRGQDYAVAENAQAIHDSFILRKKMTPDDKKALLSAVPESFVKQDRTFHALGAQLAEAARNGDKVQQQKLFSDLINACVSCHTQYATDRFPGLKKATIE
ncbi:MAG: cytochrome c [Candidatus Latescibacteria bacterium]|jgi:hypothetical protein|nr:cytochrome c [Candidatus Latescibacterota bacterium]MBT5830197.1 cytochrome c [Candidatus Latescibacterota bacterium]